MGYLKTRSDYIDLTVPFTPLPRHGHLSKKTPDYEKAEPEIRKVRSAINDVPDFPMLRAVSDDADAVMPTGGPDRYKEITTELIDITTRDGATIELKVYRSHRVNKNAVLMYRMHGGGWCIGRHEVDGIENVYAAINPNIVVVSVDYRKAPEHPFPTPNNDCYDGLIWCKKNSERLGVDPEQIIVGGGSAGAQLATSLALNCLRDGITGLIAQVLHFPATCHPKFFPKDKYEFGSYMQNHDDATLSTLSMETFYDAYTPNPEPDYRHSPLLADSFKGLPPTLIQCAGADPLRDDAFAYAESLEEAGIKVEFHCYGGLPHWFPVVLPHAKETSQFFQRYNNFLAIYTKAGRDAKL
ncbi:ab hydrolase superfamily [Fusarium longipes]|uniref:Ab hydrolase superfamily n=1 Tax=Fusarium longipes TaxID=694270 RepID=A0A395SND4_9HYPO|nr:ab hydrolase superfamily [Fusarium longipes]